MMKKDCWFASVDLKDAFYSVPIHPKHKKYLKFLWKGKIYQYTSMPNGYADAMRIFTKLLKPGFYELRRQGHLSVYFVDDSILQGDTYIAVSYTHLRAHET